MNGWEVLVRRMVGSDEFHSFRANLRIFINSMNYQIQNLTISACDR